MYCCTDLLLQEGLQLCSPLFVGVWHKETWRFAPESIRYWRKEILNWKLLFTSFFLARKGCTSHRCCNSPQALQGRQFYWKFNLFTTIEGQLSCHPQQHSANPVPIALIIIKWTFTSNFRKELDRDETHCKGSWADLVVMMKRNDYNSQLYQETLGPMLLLLKYYLDFCNFVYSISHHKVPYGSRGVGANKSTCETTVSLCTPSQPSQEHSELRL